MRVTLIDADSICWAQAWLNKDKSNEELYLSIDAQISDILTQTKADKYVGFLKNPNETEFRRIMFPTYKSNRPATPDWYKDRRESIWYHLIDNWKFVYTQNGYEADDAIASTHYHLNTVPILTPAARVPIPKVEAIICSIDKDMKQIPGWNYNPKTKELTFIGGDEAERNMLTQLLTGDSTDNIKGLPGIGPSKAKRILEGCGTNPDAVYAQYLTHHGNTAKALIDFAENVLQVVMRRDVDYAYTLVDVPENIKKYYNPTINNETQE